MTTLLMPTAGPKSTIHNIRVRAHGQKISDQIARPEKNCSGFCNGFCAV